MADNNEKNIMYWYSKLSSKLGQLKKLARILGGVDKNVIYPDEEIFLISLLKLISQKMASKGAWLSGTISQPGDYEQMLAYKCLKDSEKIGLARKLAEKMISLSLEIDVKTIDSHSTAEELILLYNQKINDVFSLNDEFAELLKIVVKDLDKEMKTNDKDVYIG